MAHVSLSIPTGRWISCSPRGCLLHAASKQGGWGWWLPRQSSCSLAWWSAFFTLPKGPAGCAAALFVCSLQWGELGAYQSVSIVKRDLAAAGAAGVSQVGVGVVDGESTQAWQGEQDTAEVVCWWRTESRRQGVQALSHFGAAWHWVQAGGELAMARPWGHLLVRHSYGSQPPQTEPGSCSWACSWLLCPNHLL